MIHISRLLVVLLSVNLSFSFKLKQTEINPTLIVNQIEDNFDIHSDLQKDYLDNEDYTDLKNIAQGVEELSKPRDLIISFDTQNDESLTLNNYYVDLSKDSDFSIYKRVDTKEKEAHFINLEKGTTYYYRVTADYIELDITSDIYSFTTANIGPRNLTIDGVTNVRDLGGYIVGNNKRIKQNQIYRNGRLNVSWQRQTIPQFTPQGKEEIEEYMKLKTEIDLRRTDLNEPSLISRSVLGEDINYIDCLMSYDEKNFYIANKASIKAAFNVLSNKEYYPISFHCDIGTDRTGALSYMLLGLLGVDVKDLEIDYLFSNFGNIGSARIVEYIRERVNYFDTLPGNNLSSRIRYYLKRIVGINEDRIDTFISNMIEEF